MATRVGANAGGLSAPRRASRLFKAGPADGPSGGGELPHGGCYVVIELLDAVLTPRFPGLGRRHPLVACDLSMTTSRLVPVKETRLVDPRQIVGVDVTTIAGGRAPIRSQLTAPLPLTGKLSGSISLLALRDQALLKGLISLAEELPQDIGGEVTEPDDADDGDAAASGAESMLLGGAATLATRAVSAAAARIGAKAALRAMKLLAAQHGTYETRLSIVLDDIQLTEGLHVIAAPSRQVRIVSVEPGDSGDRPGVFFDGRRAANQDYMVLRVRQQASLEDVTQVPHLGQAWQRLFDVIRAQGAPDDALRAIEAAVVASPYLIDKDRSRLINIAKDFASHSALNANGKESFFGVLPGARHALRVLKEAWSTGQIGFKAPQPAEPDKTASPPVDPALQGKPAVDAGEARFRKALSFTLKWEGDFVDHPNDRGGATKFGITQRVFHQWLEAMSEPLRGIETITHDEACNIYRTNYWHSASCHRLKPELDAVMFDAAVNHGPSGAVRLLQRALNSLQASPSAIAVDGAMGRRTLEALAGMKTLTVCLALIEERRKLYQRIVDKDPSQKVFLKGWLNRADDLQRAVNPGGALSGHEAAGAPAAAEWTPPAPYID